MRFSSLPCHDPDHDHLGCQRTAGSSGANGLHADAILPISRPHNLDALRRLFRRHRHSMDFLAAFQHVHGKALRGAKLTLVPFAICHDEPWTADSLRTIFLGWADKNQDRLQGDQYVAVVDALQEAMPCK